jgi:flavorubredoxin
MEASFQVQTGVHTLPAYIPIPTIGLLPVNAFLVDAAEPYLVDTGVPADEQAFVAAVEALMDPAELRWIYLTHADPDHTGALAALLERAPQAKLITTFIGFAKLQLSLRPVPPWRIRLANPGERLNLGDRTLMVLRPPLFDAPETTMVYDDELDTLFSADAFGGPLAEPVLTASELMPQRLQDAELLWASVDAPWIHHIDRARFGGRLNEISELDPTWIMSTHLPAARAMSKTLCENLSLAPDAAPFLAPDQKAFEEMLQSAAPASAATTHRRFNGPSAAR